MGTAAGIGAAANVVGGELQGWASVLDQMRMGQAYRSELEKQRQYQQQAMGVFNQQPAKSSPTGLMAGVNQGAANRIAAYNQIGQVPLGLAPRGQIGQPAYNPSVADAYVDMTGKSRAQNLGYGDYQVQQAIDNMAAQRQLSQISNFAGGQAQNVFPLQMYKAQHMYDWMSMLGQAISSIGGTAANYAQYAQQPQGTQGGMYPVATGPYSTAMWSGYGGAGNLPPPGTGYNPYTNQSTAPGIYPGYYQ